MLSEFLAPAALPADLRVYAVGDLHGCADRLDAMQQLIAADSAALAPMRTVIVYLGDYVDRGPDSAGVVERLMRPPPVAGAEVVTLLGNHEQMMLEALSPRPAQGAAGLWLGNGGAETLASYGADPDDPRSWEEAVDPDHLDFLAGCALSWAAGEYVFVHAGVRPELPLYRQDPMDLLWIREPFLSWHGELEAVIVHGHTPAERPEVLPHRIGLDTGAVFGGPLTCAVLEADRLRFLFA
jgi:serine/threonine protein phosphatase 1